jgi:hypothetical protein
MKVLRSRKQILNNVLKHRCIAAGNWAAGNWAAGNWEIAMGGLIARLVIY